ncbi:helix-turn-helix domain-containing protein [Pseudacidovorax sp. RU35E]|uniref:helix-turn-helix domain-containing protein n=1 Tax=Pseudacidovorax sp. RU35E TaxID=1907403 RepID=UPI000954AD72|nr:helix-turn-helix transcriptional regulator [Pseudacidovorax sp. RU35E]SIR52323.1 Helix-turn-helix domain-containing protein [Pseudacidovorax sp. RU35E]
MRTHQDPDLLRAFAAEVRARRDAQGHSQESLAFQCGLHRTFIAKLELGQSSPSITTLFRLADGLAAPPAELIEAVSLRLRKERAARHRLAR